MRIRADADEPWRRTFCLQGARGSPHRTFKIRCLQRTTSTAEEIDVLHDVLKDTEEWRCEGKKERSFGRVLHTSSNTGALTESRKCKAADRGTGSVRRRKLRSGCMRY